MKKILLLGFLFTMNTNFAQDGSRLEKNVKIEEIQGDLDKDGINEKIEIWNTNLKTDEGIKRELKIFKYLKSNWIIWKKYDNCLLASEAGGMMGDPFGSIEIKNGILLISHDGGSSWKWGYTDKYKFLNNEFQLIGHTSNYGKPCEYWTSFDFNISTGKIILKKEFEKCGENDEEVQKISKTLNEIFYKKNLKLTLKNRFDKEIKIISPKYKIEHYL